MKLHTLPRPLLILALILANGACGRPAPSQTRQTSDEQPLTNLGTRQQGVDWPKLLGPTGDSKSPEKGILTDWSNGRLKVVWQRPLNDGYSVGSVAKGRYFQFQAKGDQSTLLCLNAETGAEIWKFSYPNSYLDLYGYDSGPRGSPVIDGDRVYILGVQGILHCLRTSDGELVWKVDTTKRFGVIQNFFGVGGTPVVSGDLLIVMVGGSPAEDQDIPPGQIDRVSGNGTGIVAFDKFNGKVKYSITDELASYSTPTLATIKGRQWCFAFCRGGLVGFEPSSGKVDFQYPWRARILESANASSPVVVGNEVFISETYGPGSSLLSVRDGGYDVVWRDNPRSRDKAMLAHWNTPIYVDGYLYGCSGRNPPDADLRCIEWKTGKVMWTLRNRYRTSLTYIDGHFVVLDERGLLYLVKVDPQRCQIVTEAVLRDKDDANLLSYPCWAAPAISRGLMYIRTSDRVVCLDLIPQRS